MCATPGWQKRPHAPIFLTPCEANLIFDGLRREALNSDPGSARRGSISWQNQGELLLPQAREIHPSVAHENSTPSSSTRTGDHPPRCSRSPGRSDSSTIRSRFRGERRCDPYAPCVTESRPSQAAAWSRPLPRAVFAATPRFRPPAPSTSSACLPRRRACSRSGARWFQACDAQ